MTRLMIIPAAGSATRLKASVPKVLFPVNGRAMIDHLFDLYAAVIDRFILVTQPAFEERVRQHCSRRPVPVEYELQASPTGMLDAILIPRDRVQRHSPASVWITWCDQVAVHPSTVAALAALSHPAPAAALILPTVRRTRPYVHLERDAQGTIVRVLHRREGDHLPEIGESEIGLFCLSRKAYLDVLSDFAKDLEAAPVTGERNFLPFIAWLARRATVKTFPAHDEVESIGVNTIEDLRQVERYLIERERSTAG